MSGERGMVRGVIDGCVSILGVVIGVYGVDAAILLSAALARNLANSMANLLAAFSAEAAQQASQLRGIEQAMLLDLYGTALDRNTRRAARWAALTDSLATLAGGLVPVAAISGLPWASGAGALYRCLTLTAPLPGSLAWSGHAGWYILVSFHIAADGSADGGGLSPHPCGDAPH